MARFIRVVWGLAWLTVLPNVLFLVALAPPVFAQSMCTERHRLAERLGEKFSEVQVATGVAANGQALEVWAAPAGSWTIFSVTPHGSACLIASGQAWSGIGALATPESDFGDL